MEWTPEHRYIATWHPTYALYHNPYEAGAFEIDMQRFARLMRGKLDPLPERIITEPTVRLIEYLRRLGRSGVPIAIDIETAPESAELMFTGKDPTRARLKTIGLGTCELGLSKWCWHDLRGKVMIAIRRLLRDPAVIKVFHNGDWFDLRVLKRYGIDVANVHDTRDARRAMSSTSPLKLSYCGSLETDYIPWKEDESDDAKGLVFTKSKRKLKEYNAHDCVVTARVWRGITSESEWNTPRVQRLYQVHRDLARIAAQMHTNGVRVDPLMRRWMAWALKKEYFQKERKLLAAVNVDGFECSPDHLRALIFQKHATGKKAHLAKFNLPDPIDPAMYVNPKEPDTISVDEDALTLLLIDPEIPADLKAIIQLYWDAQEVWKRRSVFVTSRLISEAIGKDGRLRAGWNSCGTDTGRFSCSQPNLMNIEKTMRAMYVPAPGCIFVGADYSQLELRVMWAVSKDRALGNALATGDVYSVDAREWFQLPPDLDVKNLKPKARKAAKIIHLGSQYAAGTKTVYQQGLKQDRSMQYEMCVGLHNGFKRTYSQTVEYWGAELERVRRQGFSESRILRRRRVYPEDPAITETSNYPIQGTASDIKNLALIEVDRRLPKEIPGGKILIDLHDAIYLEVPRAKAEKARKLLHDCMEVEHTIDGDKYNFPVESKVAARWDECG